MRFVSFRDGDGPPVAGVMVGDDRVADLSHPALAARLGGMAPRVEALVEQGLQAVARRLAAEPWPPAALRPLAALRLTAPLRPGKVVGAAFNYRDALAERGMAPPAQPVIFVRSGRTVLGPGEAVAIPPDVGDVGYEAELAVLIGRRAVAVPRERAMAFVAGYLAHNDVSGSALVKADGGRFVRGKNLPASAPLGPWIATPDEIADPMNLRVRLEVDGRVLQDGRTADMLFDIAALIAHISQQMPLDPGDVIATGTPAGVAAMHQPPAWLRPGQTVTVEVEGLGRLSNPLVHGERFLEP